MEIRKSVGILPGNFDPIHYGHIQVAKEAMRLMALDQVIFVPRGQSRYEVNSAEASNVHRRRMLELMLKREEFIDYIDWELEGEGPHYTLHTLQRFKRDFPNSQPFLIVGMDKVTELVHSYGFEEVRYLCDIILAERVCKEVTLPEFRYLTMKNTLHDGSSTEIKQWAKDGLPLDDFLSESVINYIKINQLYK